jgi:hypothetical protein
MERTGKVFFINVGANANTASQGIRSPIFEDGRFEFVPIPEAWERPQARGFELAAEGLESHPQLLRYRELPCFNEAGKALSWYLPEAAHDKAVHNDPEFETYTYGGAQLRERDAAGRAGAGLSKSAKLLTAEEGDNLFFIANLTRYQAGEFLPRQAGFYFTGFLKIERYVDLDLLFAGGAPGDLFPRVSHNAHVRQFLASGDEKAARMRVFLGSREKSQRFRYAVPITRKDCDGFLRDAEGKRWKWGQNRTEMQTIGSYTRTNRCFLRPGEAGYAAFWAYVARYCGRAGERF